MKKNWKQMLRKYQKYKNVRPVATRKKKWRPKKIEYSSGTLWKYSQSVGPAFKGAITHPGAFKEKKSYADI